MGAFGVVRLLGAALIAAVALGAFGAAPVAAASPPRPRDAKGLSEALAKAGYTCERYQSTTSNMARFPGIPPATQASCLLNGKPEYAVVMTVFHRDRNAKQIWKTLQPKVCDSVTNPSRSFVLVMGANWILYGSGDQRVAAELAKALHGTTRRLDCPTETNAPETKASIIASANAACSRAQSAALADARRLDVWSGTMDPSRQSEYYTGRAQQADDLIAALETLRASPNGDVIPADAIDALRAYAQWARSIVQTIEATQTTFRQMSPQADIDAFRSAFPNGACTDVFDMN